MSVNHEQEKTLTIMQLTARIKGALEENPGLSNVWIKGEISNFTRHGSGHLYFSLKDADAQIKAVMFKRNADTVQGPIVEGLEVTAFGSVSVYEKRGEYQFYVRAMNMSGVGALYRKFEELKKKLAEEGLFDPSNKKEIPRYPGRVAVVTSPTGAAVRDVINVISRRWPAVEVTVVPAIVQGAEAPQSVREALAAAAALPDCETILLVRGGGSIEDLWGFNDEALARDIFACNVPIISGVGHETDFTIADFVADLRAPTPSAAAEIAVPNIHELLRNLSSTRSRIERRAFDLIRYYRSRLQTASVSLSPERMLDKIDRERQMLDDMLYSAARQWEFRIRTLREKLSHNEENLRALNPRNVLERGYSICRNEKTGSVVRSIKSVAHGSRVNIILIDGDFNAQADLKSAKDQTSFDF